MEKAVSPEAEPVVLRKKSTKMLETIRSMKSMDIDTTFLGLLHKKDSEEETLSPTTETNDSEQTVNENTKQTAEEEDDIQLKVTMGQLL